MNAVGQLALGRARSRWHLLPFIQSVLVSLSSPLRRNKVGNMNRYITDISNISTAPSSQFHPDRVYRIKNTQRACELHLFSVRKRKHQMCY